MNWLASLWKSSSRRGQAMSSTHEAFSLPSASPGFGAHPDAFNPDTLQSPSPLATTTDLSYTYPPQSPVSSYGYIPTSSGSRSRPSSLLPLHNNVYTNALTSPSPYPPLAHTWNRLKNWLAREYPELGDTLNYGILPQDLTQIEMQFGFSLPTAVRESYLVVDGQEAESSAGCPEGLFFGLTFLSLEEVLEEWRFWREVDDDPNTGANVRLREIMQSIPEGWVHKEYSQRGWIPLIADRAGNYVGVDLNPAEGGSAGQVIVFGRDFDTKVVLWRGDGPGGWAKWLASFADELENGEGFELGVASSESEGSEDDLGYESYFYDGRGRGQGDGGGEAGPGGLRLAGEYKGWNVLEAWADRSVKKWYESGAIADVPISSPEKGKAPEKRGLGVLNVAADSQESAAEVPIPVFSEPPPAKMTSRRPAPPAISVSKPPAPRPVGLPTVSDVVPLPSPPDSTHSLDDGDIERGHSRGITMREFSNGKLVGSPRRQPQRQSPNPERSKVVLSAPTPTLVSLPTSPVISPAQSTDLLAANPLPAPQRSADATDLLADPAPTAFEAFSIDTLPTPTQADRSRVMEPANEQKFLISSAPIALVEPAPVEAQSSVGLDVGGMNPTVRLIGGGGSVGLVDGDSNPGLQPDEEARSPDADPVEEVRSIASSSSASQESHSPTKLKKHEKNRSSISLGLKKLGSPFGAGKRKKDSSTDNAASGSMIKETTI